MSDTVVEAVFRVDSEAGAEWLVKELQRLARMDDVKLEVTGIFPAQAWDGQEATNETRRAG